MRGGDTTGRGATWPAPPCFSNHEISELRRFFGQCRIAGARTVATRLRGGRAVPAEARRTCEGQPRVCRWRHGVADGRHRRLPTNRPATAAPGVTVDPWKIARSLVLL